MEIQKNIRNDLMKRQEVSFIVDSSKNPGFADMTKQVATELKKPENCIEVYNVKGKFGRDTFLIKANVYDSPEILVKMKEMAKTKKQKDADKKAIVDAKKAEAEAKKAAEEAAKAESSAPAEESA
jgi:ribosomal protein S24E